MIFQNVFKKSFYTLFQISGLFAKLPENLETARSMKSMAKLKKKNLKNKFIQSEKFVDKTYRLFE